MKIQKYIAVLCVTSLMGGAAEAATPTNINEAIQFIQEDSVLLAGWMSNEFKHAIPYNSTSGNVVPTQFKVWGIGVGVSAVVSSHEPDNDALDNLGTSVIDTRAIDNFDQFPMPLILGHVKLGLPWGLDAGVRLGGIPPTDADEGDTHMEVTNTVFGLDLRKALIEEGVTRPFGLTLGINYTHAKGHIAASSPYDASAGSDVTFSDDSMGTARSDWKTDSVGAQIIMNKRILFMNPYIGASVNKNFGDIETTITNTGSASYQGGAYTPFTTVGSATEEADDTDLRALLGLEFTFFPTLKLSLGGELANDHHATASIGLRFQFR